MAKKRGRPKSAETLESERIKAMLKNLPSHIPRMSNQEHEELERQFAADKEIEIQIYAGHSPTIPHDLILAMESMGDRDLFEETPEILAGEQKVIRQYNKLVEAEKNGRRQGAQTTSDKANLRAKVVWGKNQDLVDKIGRNQTVHSASKRLLDEWNARGDGGPKPSIRTAENWYQKFIFK